MASRLLARSKTLTLAHRLLRPSSAAADLRPLNNLISRPLAGPKPSPLAGFSALRPFSTGSGDPQNLSKVVSGIKDTNNLKLKGSDGSKVLAFSPLEGSLGSTRKSGLWNESLKVKRLELSLKMTYTLIPALLLISKTKMTTSALVLAVYWQIYGFYREILLDYVHHEVTRKWVFIYLQLLLLILAKDTILIFGQGQA